MSANRGVVNIDWDVLNIEGLPQGVAKQAASVAAMYPTYLSEEDLEQEGLIWCALNAHEVRRLHEEGDRLLSIRIWSRLQHKVEAEAQRQGQTIGIHRLYEVGE